MRCQPWIKSLLHFFVLRQEIRHRASVLFVLLHPDRERLHAAQHQPALERRQDSARALLHVRKCLGLLRLGRHQHAAQPVAVSVQEFRRRVHDDVGAERDRLLKIWRHERVVDAQLHALRMTNIGHRANIGQCHQGIRRRLDMHQSRLRRDRALDVLRIARVHISELDAVARQYLVKQPHRSAVHVVTANDVIACAKHGEQRGDRRHAAAKHMRGGATLERR